MSLELTIDADFRSLIAPLTPQEFDLHKAQTFELRDSQVLNELHMLLKQIEKLGDKLPPKLRTYAEDAKKRSLTLFDVGAASAGGNLKLEHGELDPGAPAADKKKGAH